MAIKFQRKASINAVEVISENDDAIDQEKSDFKAYRETGDTSKLAFLPGKQPTIFLCNFALKGKEAAAIKNAMVDGKDEDGDPKLAIGTWSFRVARFTLKDIKNPADLPADEQLQFKKDEAGYCHDEVLAQLDQYGIINEIFAMYSSLVLGGAKANAKN